MAAMKSLSVHLKSTGLGMIQHNSQLANPMNPVAKEIKKYTAKRKKTDDDYETIARLEFIGGLWRNKNNEPTVPSYAIVATILEGLKKRRLGTVGRSAIHCHEDGDFIYKGPRVAEELWEIPAFRFQSLESVNNGKVLRTRPIFHDWQLKFELMFLPDVIEERDIVEALNVAGDLIGIGNRRPTNGRFIVETLKAKKAA